MDGSCCILILAYVDVYLTVWMAAAVYLPMWMAAAVYLPVWIAAAVYLPVWMSAAVYLSVWMAAAETKMKIKTIVEAVMRLMLYEVDANGVVELKIGGESTAAIWQQLCSSGRQLVHGRCALPQARNLHCACVPLQ